jgi:Cys-rich repeat protein
MSHDTNFGAIAPLPGFDSFNSQYRGADEVSVHPAVDGFGRTQNSEVTGLECTTNADCATGESCAIGLCVPPGWTDLEPATTGNPPGFLERREFVNGDSSRYDVYLSWKVTPTP